MVDRKNHPALFGKCPESDNTTLRDRHSCRRYRGPQSLTVEFFQGLRPRAREGAMENVDGRFHPWLLREVHRFLAEDTSTRRRRSDRVILK
jgi:hypothetical protein